MHSFFTLATIYYPFSAVAIKKQFEDVYTNQCLALSTTKIVYYKCHGMNKDLLIKVRNLRY